MAEVSGGFSYWKRKSWNREAKLLERFSTKGSNHEEQGGKVEKNILGIQNGVIRIWKLWNVFGNCKKLSRT